MSSSSSSNPINQQNQGSQEQPSLLACHAEFIKGSAEVSDNHSSSSHQTSRFPSSSTLSPSSPSMSASPSTTRTTPCNSCPCSPSSPAPPTAVELSALHQRNRELRKIKRLRDSRGQQADVMFVAHLSSTQSAIGSITGSHAWTTSGEQDKAHAKSNMKAAAEIRDSAGKGYGHVEEVAGKLTGCEGMKEEGKISAERAKRRD